MSVIIGNVTLDGGTGTPHPPLSFGALKAYAETAQSFRFKGTAPTSEGAMMVWQDCSEVEAQRQLRALGALVGYIVLVQYPHGNIAGVAVATVRGEWQAKAGTANGGVLVAHVTFDRTSEKQSGDETRSLVVVQTAAALAGPWTTETNWASLKGSDGIGTYAGEAVVTVVGQAPDQAKVGLWVRMVLKSAVDPAAPTPAEIDWAGVITGVSSEARRDPNIGIGWGARTAYRCAGVAHVFAQLFPMSWWEMQESNTTALPYQGTAPSTDTFTDVGRPIDYNADGIGNASFTEVQLDAAPAPLVILHSRGRGTNGQTWTATMALHNAIAQVRRYVPTLFPIVVEAWSGSGPVQDNKLFYSEPWPVGRQSLLGIIDTIVNSDNLRTFRFVIDWAASPVAVKIVVSDATPTTGDTGIALDLTTEDTASWNADWDGGTVRDLWALDAGDRSFIMTMEVQPIDNIEGLQRGFLLAQQTAWEAAPAAAPALLRNNNDLVHVWRQYALSPKWEGTNHLGSQEMPYERVIDAGQETGELEVGIGLYPTGIMAWRFDRALPLGEGFDWTTPVTPPSGGNKGVVTRSGPTTGPLVWWRKSGEPLDQIHDDYQIDYGDATASVSFGRNAEEGEAIRAKMVTDGFTIWMTVAWVHPKSWRVTAVQTAPRTDAPRMGVTWLPSSTFNRTDLLAGTILSVDASGAPVYGTAGRRDGAGSLINLRDKHRQYVQANTAAIEWTYRNITDTTAPGTIVASAKLVVATDPLTEVTLTTRVVIARRTRSWDAYNPYTAWTASVLLPNLGGSSAAVIAAAAKRVAILNRAYKDTAGAHNA